MRKSINKKAVVLLIRKPSHAWFSFLNNFTVYDVFAVVDDNACDIAVFQSLYTKVTIVRIDAEMCKKKGICNFLIPNDAVPGGVLAWDKAIFFLFYHTTGYRHFWFIEDDVFVDSESTLVAMDNMYPSSDLLSNENYINLNGDVHEGWWWWFLAAEANLPSPWCKSMLCACRISRRLLELIVYYGRYNRTLIHHEILVNTLAYHHKLVIHTPTPLYYITYRDTWEDSKFQPGNLYHPMKDMNAHIRLRARFLSRKYSCRDSNSGCSVISTVD